MKNQIIITSLLVLFLIPFISDGKSLKGLEIRISDDINRDCLFLDAGDKQYDEVRGCYFQNVIHIKNGLPKEISKYVLAHELGHYFLDETSEEKLKEVFKPHYQKIKSTTYREYSVDEFAFWLLGGKVRKNVESFFVDALLK